MKRSFLRTFFISIIVIFILQAFMLIYMFGSFYKTAAEDIKSLGESNLAGQAAMIENYLNKGEDVLWLAADTVEFMLDQGNECEEILAYMTEITRETQSHFDENFTGIYGYLNGDYVDGSGWEPPEDYDPTQRDWYLEAKAARGKMVLSSPYVDAQTGGIIVSYVKLLSDGKSVLALDITLNEVQKITEEMSGGDLGYSFIVDPNGLVLAHSDPNEIGKNYVDDPEKIRFISGLRIMKSGSFGMELDGEKCTVFTEQIANDWNVAVVMNNALLFHKLRLQLYVGVALSVLIYSVILIFSVISIKRITSAEESEQESMEQMRTMNINIIRSLATTVDAKDRYTSGHSQRVADYAVRIAKKLGKSEETRQIIYYAGLLHDVGKISVPLDVINKPGKLTEEEFDKIRIHPVSGYHILRGIHKDVRIGYGAKYHHERYDGKGYPNGLSGENIPEVARIIAVADAYDAMASDRSYRKLLPQKKIREEIEKGKGTQFDPVIADAMLSIMDEDTTYDLRQSEEDVYNILVIDDDRDILQELISILSDVENVCLRYANTKREAMELLEDHEFVLILLDPSIAETDGFALYEAIRERYDTPVIVMSSDKSQETVSKVEELKIDDYLTKPLYPAVVREAIRGILQRFAAKID
ncbi:MAG: HD domain-containing protein [Lachnospiraceae bacterium]|nr:HD domain-containing protein [Lachnospiraceae bacterium]